MNKCPVFNHPLNHFFSSLQSLIIQGAQGLSSVLILGGICVTLWLSGMTPAAALQDAPQELKALEQIFTAGFAATAAGDFAQAESQWTQAIDLMPDNAAAWSNRGNARLSQWHLEAALEDFNEAVRLAPTVPDPYINRGIAWESLGQWDTAIADYDYAIRLNPKDAVAYNNRGNAKGGAGDWQGAAADFKTATELSPGLAVAGVNYALALYQIGDDRESLRLLKNLVRKYSQFADPRAALTAVLWDQGSKGEAESNWYPVMGLDPRYKDLEWLKTYRRWPPKAIIAIERFLKLYPK